MPGLNAPLPSYRRNPTSAETRPIIRAAFTFQFRKARRKEMSSVSLCNFTMDVTFLNVPRFEMENWGIVLLIYRVNL